MVGRLQARIMPNCTRGCHVEDRSNVGPTAPDHALTAHCAAVAIERGDADQGAYLSAVESPELGQGYEQGRRGNLANAWYRLKQVVLLPPDRALLHAASDVAIVTADPLLEPIDVLLDVLFGRLRRAHS